MTAIPKTNPATVMVSRSVPAWFRRCKTLGSRSRPTTTTTVTKTSKTPRILPMFTSGPLCNCATEEINVRTTTATRSSRTVILIARFPARWWINPVSGKIFSIMAELDATNIPATKRLSGAHPQEWTNRTDDIKDQRAAESYRQDDTDPHPPQLRDAQIESDGKHQEYQT